MNRRRLFQSILGGFSGAAVAPIAVRAVRRISPGGWKIHVSQLGEPEGRRFTADELRPLLAVLRRQRQ